MPRSAETAALGKFKITVSWIWVNQERARENAQSPSRGLLPRKEGSEMALVKLQQQVFVVTLVVTKQASLSLQ